MSVSRHRGFQHTLRSGLRIAAFIAAASMVSSGSALAWGTLCVGEDGHVAFEAFADGKCVDGTAAPSPTHAAHLNACDGEAGCGPCTDLRSAPGAWPGRTTSPPQTSPSAFALPSLALHATPSARAPAFLLRRSAPGPHRSVTAIAVLRC
jgi:nitrite reductase/ring-hydroxylating ferredoxin subunit